MDFIQKVKKNDDSLQNAGRLTYYDVSFFVNPDAFRHLLCRLHSRLPQANGGVVDATDDVEQFKAQMVTASGDASAVTILITSFEQIITCAHCRAPLVRPTVILVPGTLSCVVYYYE